MDTSTVEGVADRTSCDAVRAGRPGREDRVRVGAAVDVQAEQRAHPAEKRDAVAAGQGVHLQHVVGRLGVRDEDATSRPVSACTTPPAAETAMVSALAVPFTVTVSLAPSAAAEVGVDPGDAGAGQ